MSKLSVYDPNIEVDIIRNGERMSVPFFSVKEGDHPVDYPGTTVGDGGAHFSGDESYDGYMFFDTDGNEYFPEDFGAELIFNGGDDDNDEEEESDTVVIEDIEDVTGDILADIEAQGGESCYFGIAHLERDSDISASVSVRVDDTDSGEKQYAIHLVDYINDSSAEWFYASFSQPALEQAIREIAEGVVADANT